MYQYDGTRNVYPSDGSNEEWTFVALSLTLIDEAAPQRNSPTLHNVANGLRYLLHTGAPWRMLPTDVTPWHVVCQQTQRWLKAGVFAQMAHDVRMLLRDITNCTPQPHAVIVDSQTLPLTPASGGRTGCNGHNQRNGATVHMAMATLGQLLAVMVTPANDHNRAQVAAMAHRMQEVNGDAVAVAFVDQGDTGVQSQPMPLPTVFAWKWSRFRPPGEVLVCCRSAGWLSAASPG